MAHFHEQYTLEFQYVQALSRPLVSPPGHYGHIFCTVWNDQPGVDLRHYPPSVCLMMSLTHSIDEVKAEIQRVWGIAPERQGLRFFTHGRQKRSPKRLVTWQHNMHLVEHLIQSQFTGPHAPVIGPGWAMDCVVWVRQPRRRISQKRPDVHKHYNF